MTLPTDYDFPPLNPQNEYSAADMYKYLREQRISLTEMYNLLADGINGDIRADWGSDYNDWTPILKDTANSGTTFTYSHQAGWVYRRGIFVDVWFDIGWSANSGAITGNMYIELPYEVAVTNQMPFVGTVQPSGFTYSAGTECVVNAISDTYRAEIWNCGSGVTTTNQASVSSGRLIGHIRYIGQDET